MMEELAQYFTEEEREEKEQFVIDTDEKAEWALLKIKEEQAESQRMINVCNSFILHYKNEIKKAEESLERKTGNLKAMLFEYFQTVDRKATKTQETYTLPSGKLKLKYPQPEYKRDDATLVKWLKDRNMTDYIKTKEEPQWGELKKTVQIAGDKACIDGEIIDGIQVVEKAPVFDIEL
jgi:hypothetical protein